MGIQKPELFQKVTKQPWVWCQEAGNGWSKGYSLKDKGAINPSSWVQKISLTVSIGYRLQNFILALQIWSANA